MMINLEVEIPQFKAKVQAVISKYHTSRRPAEIIVMRVSGWTLKKICAFYAYKDLEPIYSNIRHALNKTNFEDAVTFAIDVTKYINSLFAEMS